MRRKRSIGIIVRHALVEIQPGRAHTLVEEEEKEDYSRCLVSGRTQILVPCDPYIDAEPLS